MYSAAANGHPVSRMRMIPTATSVVDASWNAIAAVRLAPVTNSVRANATAA